MKVFKGVARPDLGSVGPTQTGNDDLPRSDAVLRSILPDVIEALSDGISIARMAGEGGPLIYVNSAFERLTGYGQHEVLGKDCRYLQGNDRDQVEIPRMRTAIRAAEPVDVTLRNYRKDGSLFWNALSLRPISAGGDLFYLGILRDVSTIRQTEAALDRAANLDVATGCLNRQSLMADAE